MRALDPATLAVKRELSLPAGATVHADMGRVLLLQDGPRLRRCSLDAGTCTPLPMPPVSVGASAGVRISASGRTVAIGETGNTPIDFRLHVLDADAAKPGWRTVAGRGHPVAGGAYELCALDEARASWCWSRGPDPEVQDLATGKVLDPSPRPPRPTTWSARRASYPQDEPGIEISGSGRSRWVEGTETDAGSPPSNRGVLTCGSSNLALVVRDDALELRALPEWRRVAGWEGDVVSAVCSTDGNRVAWLAKTASGVEVRVVDR